MPHRAAIFSTCTLSHVKNPSRGVWNGEKKSAGLKMSWERDGRSSWKANCSRYAHGPLYAACVYMYVGECMRAIASACSTFLILCVPCGISHLSWHMPGVIVRCMWRERLREREATISHNYSLIVWLSMTHFYK